jgi:hypothetical protein
MFYMSSVTELSSSSSSDAPATIRRHGRHNRHSCQRVKTLGAVSCEFSGSGNWNFLLYACLIAILESVWTDPSSTRTAE